MGGRRPGLPDFAWQVISSWFTCDRQFLSTRMDYLCWMLLRLPGPFMACNQVQSPEEQKISRWRGFHAITQPGIPAETNIGYHPMINAEASNFITFDLPLYANAKQLQLKYPEEFKNTYQNRRLSRCLKVPFSVKESMQIQAWNTC